MATLFRNIHTIKGNARTFGLKFLTDAIHEAEQTYNNLRKNEQLRWNQENLLNELRDTDSYIKQYEKIFQEKLGGDSREKGVFIESEVLHQTQTLNTRNLKISKYSYEKSSTIRNCRLYYL